MSDETLDQSHPQSSDGGLARRQFVSSVAATFAAAAGTASAAVALEEKDVEIKTPDGTCDAAFIHPRSGKHPGVIIWTDVFGLRPVMRDIGKRIAAEGYSVLVPNPYYRVAHGLVFEDPTKFSFSSKEDMDKLRPLTASIAPGGAIERDAVAYVEFLDAQASVNTAKKIGTQGYCMGGPLVVRTCAAVPDRLGAGGSFHGGGLVTNQPNSPHLLAPKIKGRMYFAIAGSDDQRQPDAKDKLKEAFAAAHVTAEVELYSDAIHGWCVADMPLQNGAPIYNKPEAERAWAKLVALYKSGLA